MSSAPLPVHSWWECTYDLHTLKEAEDEEEEEDEEEAEEEEEKEEEKEAEKTKK